MIDVLKKFISKGNNNSNTLSEFVKFISKITKVIMS